MTLQASLWNGGLAWVAGVNDLVIAATAIVHGAVVLHYDADYEHIATVLGTPPHLGGTARLLGVIDPSRLGVQRVSLLRAGAGERSLITGNDGHDSSMARPQGKMVTRENRGRIIRRVAGG